MIRVFLLLGTVCLRHPPYPVLPSCPLSRAFPYPQSGDAGGRRSAPAVCQSLTLEDHTKILLKSYILHSYRCRILSVILRQRKNYVTSTSTKAPCHVIPPNSVAGLNRWSSLDQETVDVGSIDSFKGRLDKIRKTRMGFLWTLHGPLRPRPHGDGTPPEATQGELQGENIFKHAGKPAIFVAHCRMFILSSTCAVHVLAYT